MKTLLLIGASMTTQSTVMIARDAAQTSISLAKDSFRREPIKEDFAEKLKYTSNMAIREEEIEHLPKKTLYPRNRKERREQERQLRKKR